MPITASPPSERLPRTRARSRAAASDTTGRARTKSKARRGSRAGEAVRDTKLKAAGSAKPAGPKAAGKRKRTHTSKAASEGKRAPEAKGVGKAKRSAKAKVGGKTETRSRANLDRPARAVSKARGLRAPRKAVAEPAQQPDPTHAFLGLATATGLGLAFSYALAKPTTAWKLGWAGLAVLTLVSLGAAVLSFKNRDRPVLSQVAGWFMLAVTVCLVGGTGYLALFNPLGFEAPGGGTGRAAVFGFWCLVGAKLGRYAKSLLDATPVSPVAS